MNLSTYDLNKRFFSGHSAALNCIVAALAPVQQIRIATAYFEPSGFQCLQDVLAGKQVALLVGREEGGRDRAKDVINEFVDKLAAHPLERRMRAIRLMLDALENNLLLVSVGDSVDDAALLDARYLYHHAKIYIGDENAAVVTSANMSHRQCWDIRCWHCRGCCSVYSSASASTDISTRYSSVGLSSCC